MATRKKAVSKKRTSTKTRTKTRTRKKSTRKKSEFPSEIFAIASPISVGGQSMFEAGEFATCDTVANFQSEDDLIQRGILRLQDAGFTVHHATSIMIHFSGKKATFEKAFETSLVTEERDVIKEMTKQDKATFIECPDTETPGLISTANTSFADVLEGVAIEVPRYFMAAKAWPPLKEYWHLDVPAGVSLGCNADRAHRNGITGKDIKVAMVDSGWFRHPFFTQRGYRSDNAILGPGASNPLNDESGHGTGESANVFSIAPDVQLLPVKINFANSTGAFNAAVALNPDIITNSWGSSIQFGPLGAADQALAAAIAAAVASGITVVFSAGNGHFGFPGQHPDVISAGGVFMEENGDLRASDYASGFMSNVYPGRRTPDLSGLVGMMPGAQYIMLPVEPGDNLDTGSAGGTHPNGDETASDDGWAAFSGTSAAAPQIAGAAALIKQACNRLSPAEIKDVLMRTAKDVTTGTNNNGNTATVGPDTATGNGLLDAHRATLVAKLRCISLPIQPIRPLLPLTPIQPIRPLRPVLPLQPIRPLIPLRPIRPIRPLLPLNPIRPLIPIRPLLPPDPGRPFDEEGEVYSDAGLSADDLRALENMVIESDDDIF